ncbi:MAG: hypothetical protein ABFD08_20640 [Syntrophomonas sp.]
MSIIIIREERSEENAALVQVKTRKYKAEALANDMDDAEFIVATAKKSSIEAKNQCPRCGKPISKHESRTCEICGSESCIYCWGEEQ